MPRRLVVITRQERDCVYFLHEWNPPQSARAFGGIVSAVSIRRRAGRRRQLGFGFMIQVENDGRRIGDSSRIRARRRDMPSRLDPTCRSIVSLFSAALLLHGIPDHDEP